MKVTFQPLGPQHQKGRLEYKDLNFFDTTLNLTEQNLETLFQKHKDKTFISFENTNFSFLEVLNKAQEIKRYLIEIGIQAQDRIIIRFWNEADFVFAYFGALMAEAVVVTVSPLLTESELDNIFEHSEAKLGLSFENIEACVKPIIDLKNLPNVNPLQALQREATKEFLPENLRVIIYTSGTTAHPKGVMLTQENIEAQVKASSKVLNLTKEDSFLGVLSLSHVFGQMDVLWTALFCGCTVHLVKNFEAKQALKILEKKEISVLIAVPTMYQLMLRNLEKNPIKFPSLRVCHSGAAPMPKKLFESIEEHFKTPVQEGYGLTETCSMAFSNPMEGTRKKLSVGKPIEGVSFKIIDETGKLIKAPNQIGEVCIKGPIITPGYFKATETTQKSFCSEGFLLTGDLGYFDNEGYLFLVDRKKDMIIRSGYKVYPREVEEVLLQHPMVFQVAVIGIDNSLQINKIKAFIVPKTFAEREREIKPFEENLFIQELKDLCQAKLAKFKIPNQYEIIQKIPTTPSGKLLKRQLTSI